jgi:hypothetical protein
MIEVVSFPYKNIQMTRKLKVFQMIKLLLPLFIHVMDTQDFLRFKVVFCWANVHLKWFRYIIKV